MKDLVEKSLVSNGIDFITLKDFEKYFESKIYNQFKKYRPFKEAREYVRSLGLGGYKEWREWARSDERPDDIPYSPNSVYKDKGWQDYGDWLGTGRVQATNLRPFEEAREYARSLKLKGQKEWREWARSDKRPNDIPYSPNSVYKDKGWQGYGDWLGTGRVQATNLRPFEEAREYARSLKLKGQKEWREWARSDERPDDIPYSPNHFYKDKGWQGYGDWLGTGRVQATNLRPFEEAREYARSLKLKGQKEWREWARSDERPDDIPYSPHSVYKDKGWQGYGDWLGIRSVWNTNAIKVFVKDIIDHIPSLENVELYSFMLRKGLLTLTESNQHKGFVKDISKGRIPLKDLKEWAEGDSEELPKPKVLRLPFNLNISFAEGDSEELSKPKGQANEIEDSSADNLDELNEDEDLGEVKDIDEAIRSKKSLPVVRAKDALKSAEVLCASSDEEAVEFYIASGVTKIWKYAYHNEAEAIEEVNNFKVNEYSARVRERFLTQYNGAKALIIPGGYSFSKDGKYYEPNLMQRLIAFRVLTERRVGNFSGTGAGKTLGAILAARVCEARVTIIICPNTVVDIWKDNIKLIYPDSLVYTKEIVSGLGGKNTYIVLNYEMFQQADSEDKVLGLIRNSVDLIVLDEVHYSKQRYEKKSSKRRKLINRLLSLSRQRNPDLRVLGLSATPVINNLYEGKSLLDMILGNKVDLDTKETIPNAVALFEKFTTIGVRQVPEYEIDLDTKFIDVDCSRYLDEIRDIGKGQVLELESILTMARLKTILKEIRPQTVIYTNYVGNVILDLLYCAVKREGYSVGLYTGEYKSGLKPFLDKQIDVLIGSDAIATGVDGLQFVSNRLILNTLPWTNAQYTQLIGRLHRQGQVREKVKVVIPKTYADIGDERWSYCDSKWKRIMYKATIGDCVVDGVIPLGELRSPEQALNDALEWFKRLDAERLDKLVV